jgi:metal-dependent hydrolase (beta-lactamase superfamily II)
VATEDYVQQTVAALKDINVDYLIPLHCTGEPFYEIAKIEMPKQAAALLHRNALRLRRLRRIMCRPKPATAA